MHFSHEESYRLYGRSRIIIETLFYVVGTIILIYSFSLWEMSISGALTV